MEAFDQNASGLISVGVNSLWPIAFDGPAAFDGD
jgi:hypothetical protein